MITEDYVSFETAKLLKEKGFDAYCTKFYNNLNQDRTFELCNAQQLERTSVVSNKILDDYLPTLQVKSIGYAAPTLQMSMKWLREKYNQNVTVKAINNVTRLKTIYYAEVQNLLEPGENGFCVNGCIFKDSYEEAVEYAINYCLESLI